MRRRGSARETKRRPTEKRRRKPTTLEAGRLQPSLSPPPPLLVPHPLLLLMRLKTSKVKAKTAAALLHCALTPLPPSPPPRLSRPRPRPPRRCWELGQSGTVRVSHWCATSSNLITPSRSQLFQRKLLPLLPSHLLSSHLLLLPPRPHQRRRQLSHFSILSHCGSSATCSNSMCSGRHMHTKKHS